MRLTTLATVALVGGVLFAAPVPAKKEPPEPEWMANFRKAYQLKDGEYVKRVAPPYIDERINYKLHPLTGKEEVDAINRTSAIEYSLFSTLFVEQDGKKLTKRMVLSSAYLKAQPAKQQGNNLLTVWDAIGCVTGLESPELVIDPKSKDDPLKFDNSL